MTQSGNGVELLAQLHRRHQASKRIVGGDPLSRAERALGCERDHPYPTRTSLSRNQIEAADTTARQLLAAGLMPVFDLEIARAMWRRDRELGARLAVPRD